MKKTTIPFVDFSSTSLDELPLLLETRGRRLHIDTLPWETNFPYHPITVVDVAHCPEGIALHYFVRGLDLRTLSEGDGHYVHEDSCVEFFMQREAGEAYINFEFNAAGICYASHHPRVGEGTGFTTGEFATIRRKATYANQKLDQMGLYTWELTALIPWTTMGYGQGERPESMRANFYKCADGTAHPHYLSWSPIEEEQPAFHRPQFFGELIFEA